MRRSETSCRGSCSSPCRQNGGLVHGAFLPSGELIGFCFAFAGLRGGRLRLCSHQLAVLPGFRGRGVGVALKQAQARDALGLGYELISWTFDPLEARNAYINLHRLGCIARVYDRNHYGEMEDELNRGLPSDRFEAEYWLRGRPAFGPSGAPVRALLVAEGERPLQGEAIVPGKPALVEIPATSRRSSTAICSWH